MTKEVTLLPLGTAVSIKNDDSKYVIMARTFIKQKTGEMLATYKGVPHPFGESSTYKTIIIKVGDISKVEQLGYEDELDKEFIKQRLDNAAEQPNKPVDPVVSKATIPKAPTTTPKPIQEEETLEYPNDPFYKLRNRGKENV